MTSAPEAERAGRAEGAEEVDRAEAVDGTDGGTAGAGAPARTTTEDDKRLPGPFWKLWTATFVASWGDGLRLAALPLTAALFTRDPMLLSLVTFAGQLPWVLAGTFAGAFVDRHDQQRVMFWADASRALIAALFTLALVTGHGHIALLVVFALVMGVVETLRDSAALAVLPRLVAEPALDKANSLLQGGAMLCVELAGPPLAALLLLSGTSLPYAVDALTFALSALLLARLAGAVPRSAARAAGTSLLADAGEGIRWLWRHRLLRAVCALVGAFNFALSAVVSVAVLYAYDVLGVDSVGYGLLMSVIAVGGVVGVVVTPFLTRRLGRTRTLLLCCGLAPLAFAVAGSTSRPLPAAGVLSVVGMALAVITVVTTSLRQVLVPGELLGRVGSSYRLVAVGMAPLGALAGGATASLAGLRAPFYLAAAGLAAAWVLSLPALSRE
ncbi:MFS transporter [Streptomyces sp. NPDC096046]|uniref:MFS transporter n=1 Tax=Streptomyces sp. NPDC096046 TaxID=3155542 RepID=UPI00332585EE